MIALRFDQLAAVTGGQIYSAADKSAAMFRGVSIDSRTLADGELFVAIRGEKFDGHQFIAQAIAKGAAGVIAQYDYPGLDQMGQNVPIVVVPDSHEAMIVLAKQYRHAINARFIGITGSNGKTTTKELTYRLIEALEPSAYRSPGNLNNLFGVPLTLFKVPGDCRVAVLEMGISTHVEMPRLVEIVEPDVVAITNVSATHLEFLGTIEAVAQAKLDLVRSSRPDVPAIINADDPVLMKEAARIRQNYVTFGLHDHADFHPDRWEIGNDGTTMVVLEGHRFHLPLVGKHQVYNLTAAYAIARTLGYDYTIVDTEKLVLETAPMRGEYVQRGGARILVDCYNANPENVKAGLAGFFAIGGEHRRVVVLGDMLELGVDSPRYHREIGAALAQYPFDAAVFVGPLSAETLEGAVAAGGNRRHMRHYPDAKACAREIAGLIENNDLVYLKASRGIGLEEVLRGLSDPGEEK